MLERIKNFFKDPPLEKNELVEQLEKMLYDERLEEILFDPAGKLYVLCTYSGDINELHQSLYTGGSPADLTMSNVYSYGKNITNVKRQLEGMITRLLDHKPNAKVEQDIGELYYAYNELRTWGDKDGNVTTEDV